MAFYKIFCCCCPMGLTSIFGRNFTVEPSTNSDDLLEMSCEDCNTKFSFLKRKRTCNNCDHHYCGTCLRKSRGLEKHTCHRCLVLCAVPLDKSAVSDLKVRDLRWFLQTNKIQTVGCMEKSELVELVMHYGSLRNAAYAYPQNFERHTQKPDIFSSPCISEDEDSSRLSGDDGINMSPEVERHSPQVSNVPDASSSLHILQPHNIQHHDTDEIRNSGSTSNLENEQPEVQTTQVKEILKPEEPAGPPFTPQSIHDITNVDQISSLTVMQMKLMLTRNFVGFKGCCEKQELQQKVRQLWQKTQECKDTDSIPDENICKICMDAPINAVLLDCGHLVTCTDCGKQLTECPVCRQYVVRVVHIFKA